MIISRAPVRVPLGGGGTDLPAYYEKYGGELITAAVNSYVFTVVKKHFEDTIRFNGYYNKEVVDTAAEIANPAVHAVLRFLEIDEGIEISSLSDVPANTGLGTSSSFIVCLLSALHAFKGDNPSPLTLAQEALTIERDLLEEPGGVQDQYIAAYGGITSLKISKQGEVAVTPLRIDPAVLSNLENRLVFFYTKQQRVAMEIQGEHVKSIAASDNQVLESLHEIKSIGIKSKEAICVGDLDYYGRLLNDHWNSKKRVSSNISNPGVDRWYDMAMDSGALGGKLIGAGGGGFLMFYCQTEAKELVRKGFAREGLKEINFRFEPSGAKVVMNI